MPRPKRQIAESDKVAYCGLSPVPYDKRRGTLRECLKLKQVRHYGEVAPEAVIEDHKKANITKKVEMTIESLREKIINLDEKLKRAIKSINKEEDKAKPDEDKLAKLEPQKKLYQKEFKFFIDVYKKLMVDEKSSRKSTPWTTPTSSCKNTPWTTPASSRKSTPWTTPSSSRKNSPKKVKKVKNPPRESPKPPK